MFEEVCMLNLDSLNIVPCKHVTNVPLIHVFLMFSGQLK